MPEKVPHTGKSATSSPLSFAPTQLAEMGKKQVEATIAMQTELLGKLQDMNREWFARAQSQIDLGSEFATKITAARSFPEAATVGQEWASKRMNMLVEDGRRFVAAGQNLAETCARFYSNGSTRRSG